MADILIARQIKTLFDKWSRTALIYGQTDCAMSVFQFISDAYGDDRLIARWRGQYAGRLAAGRLIKLHGGETEFARLQLESVGFRQAIDARAGDVGIVRDDRGQAILAVCSKPGRWLSKADFGVFIHNRVAETVWTKGD